LRRHQSSPGVSGGSIALDAEHTHACP
jgi:hypothetical protein